MTFTDLIKGIRDWANEKFAKTEDIPDMSDLTDLQGDMSTVKKDYYYVSVDDAYQLESTEGWKPITMSNILPNNITFNKKTAKIYQFDTCALIAANLGGSSDNYLFRTTDNFQTYEQLSILSGNALQYLLNRFENGVAFFNDSANPGVWTDDGITFHNLSFKFVGHPISGVRYCKGYWFSGEYYTNDLSADFQLISSDHFGLTNPEFITYSENDSEEGDYIYMLYDRVSHNLVLIKEDLSYDIKNIILDNNYFPAQLSGNKFITYFIQYGTLYVKGYRMEADGIYTIGTANGYADLPSSVIGFPQYISTPTKEGCYISVFGTDKSVTFRINAGFTTLTKMDHVYYLTDSLYRMEDSDNQSYQTPVRTEIMDPKFTIPFTQEEKEKLASLTPGGSSSVDTELGNLTESGVLDILNESDSSEVTP